MTSDQQIGMISQILTGGTGFGGMAPMPPSHASEFYRAVPQPNLLQTGAMAIAGAMGMQGLTALPSVAPGQGIGEAMYATNVNAKIWERMQSEAVAQMSRGLAHDLSNIGTTMGLPSMMGMSTGEFRRMVDKGAGSALGMGVVGQLANMPEFQQMQGGNVMGTYQSAFANRHLFGMPAGFAHPLDVGAQNSAAAISMDINNALVHSAYGTPNGGIGMLPNYNFTRGFSINDLQSSMQRMQQGGRWGDVASKMTAMGQGPESQQFTQGMMADVGKYAKMMEALGDVMGSRDMAALQQSLTKMTQGQWERADFGQISAGLRQLQGMAQVLGRSKDEMTQTLGAIQGALQGGVGIGASQIAMGVTAGGYGGFAAAANMTNRVYGIAAATGATRPEDINRITMQQTTLQNMGMNSFAGRAMSLAAYMSQEGMLDDNEYAALREGLVSGDAGTKTVMVNDLLKRKFGSQAAGMEKLNDPRFMAMIRAGTSEATAGDVVRAIQSGQSAEWSERVRGAGRAGLGRSLSGIAGQIGQTGALGGDASYGGMADAVFGFFDQQGQSTSATFLRSAYADAMARPGSTKASAYQAMMGMMRSNIGQEFWGGATAAAQGAALNAGVAAVEAGGVAGADAKALLYGLRSTGAVGKFSSADRTAYSAALKQLQSGDGAGALAAGEALLGGVAAESRDVINNNRALARQRAGAAVLEAGRRSESLNRIDRVGRLGLSVSDATAMQSDVTGQLTSWNKMLQNGGSFSDVNAAARNWLGDPSAGPLSREQQARRYYVGAAKAERMFDIKSLEDMQALLNEQKAIEVWDKVTSQEAAIGRGVPLDITKGLSDSERGMMSAADIQAISMSAGIWNQVAADQGQNFRASTPQLALSWMSGKGSLMRALGISDETYNVMSGGDKRAINKWVKGGDKYSTAMGAATSAWGEEFKGMQDIIMGSGADGAAISGMLESYNAKVGSGAIKVTDTKGLDKFLGEYNNLPQNAVNQMRRLHKAAAGQYAASQEFADYMGKAPVDKEKIDSMTAVATGRRAISEGSMEEAAGSYLSSGLSVVGAMGANMSVFRPSEIAAVARLRGKSFWTTTQRDYEEVAKKYSTKESLSSLSSEGMNDAAILFRSAQRQFNKAGGGSGKSSKVTGTLTIINGNKRETALVNMTSE